ncbi:integral membrane protein [Xylaria acuta]|nr:integral membrane protein [Xylaria acuta]
MDGGPRILSMRGWKHILPGSLQHVYYYSYLCFDTQGNELLFPVCSSIQVINFEVLVLHFTPRPPKFLGSCTMNSNKGLLLGFLVFYILLIRFLQSLCWKDPTSKFFKSEKAHTTTYSTYRIQQAVQHAADLPSTLAESQVQKSRKGPPELCIGIPSVRREGISYLKLALGSLQHGLSSEERMRLHFVVLIAHVNQTEHPDYDKPWLASMVDTLASYSDNEERLRLAQTMDPRSHAIKSKFDYSIVMEECEKTGAHYVLMIEDDVVFLDGWRHRTMKALDIATTKSWEAGKADFLYLRLFYYEGLLGWNSESWPTYLGSSLAVTATVLSSLLLARRYVARTHISYSLILLVTLVFTPLLIILFFAAGRNCTLPQSTGVHIMDKYGCCGQGLVFPRSTVINDLLPFFRSNISSTVPTDSYIEQHADNTGALRWALTPVVMQHVGGQSSHNGRRGDTYGPSRLWNFGFEGNDATQLAAEHAEAQDELIDETEIDFS